jgi:hypothetical protein
MKAELDTAFRWNGSRKINKTDVRIQAKKKTYLQSKMELIP